MPNVTPVVFHNGSNYDYHFIIKEKADEFEERFECLGENDKEKNIIKIDKDGSNYVLENKIYW